MKKFDLPLFADTAFYAAIVWIFSLGLLRYLGVKIAVALLICTFFALATGGLTALLLSKKHKKAHLSAKEREARDGLMLHLALEKKEKVRALLLDAFTADGKNVHCQQDGLMLEGVPLIPLFSLQPVSADAVARLLRDHGEQTFTVACNSLTPEAQKLLSDFGRNAMQKDEIFALFDRTQTMPSPLICGNLPRRTARQKVRRAFSKRNAKPFFVSGFLLLIMSLFTFFPVYYIVTGGVLLITSVFVRALGFAPDQT